jgi:hypothetical protein
MRLVDCAWYRRPHGIISRVVLQMDHWARPEKLKIMDWLIMCGCGSGDGVLLLVSFVALNHTTCRIKRRERG